MIEDDKLLKAALRIAVRYMPREVAFPYNKYIIEAAPYFAREYWDGDDIMILFKTEEDMIAFDYKDYLLNYQDVLDRSRQLYRDIYTRYKRSKEQ